MSASYTCDRCGFTEPAGKVRGQWFSVSALNVAGAYVSTFCSGHCLGGMQFNSGDPAAERAAGVRAPYKDVA